MVLIHVGVVSIPTLNWGLRFITETVSTYFCPVGITIFEEMNKKENRINRSQLLLVERAEVTPEGFTGKINSHC